MSTHRFDTGLTRSPAALKTNCWAGWSWQPTIWIGVLFAVPPPAASRHLPFEVCSWPLTWFQRCALVPLQVYICTSTPSEKLAPGTSMHLLFMLLMIAWPVPPPPPVVVSDRPNTLRISLTGWNHIVPPDEQL